MINEYLFSIIDKMFLIWLYHRQPSKQHLDDSKADDRKCCGHAIWLQCVRPISTIYLSLLRNILFEICRRIIFCLISCFSACVYRRLTAPQLGFSVLCVFIMGSRYGVVLGIVDVSFVESNHKTLRCWQLSSLAGIDDRKM